jgi:hypothetical protein
MQVLIKFELWTHCQRYKASLSTMRAVCCLFTEDTKTPLDRKGAAFIKCGVLTPRRNPDCRGRRTRTDVSSLFATNL